MRDEYMLFEQCNPQLYPFNSEPYSSLDQLATYLLKALALSYGHQLPPTLKKAKVIDTIRKIYEVVLTFGEPTE